MVAHRLERAAGDAVLALARLIRIGGGADRNPLAGPGGFRQLLAQHLGQIGLDEDLCFEVLVGVQPEVGVGGTGITVVAGIVQTAATRRRSSSSSRGPWPAVPECGCRRIATN